MKKTIATRGELCWKVHTPNLLGEILNNNGVAVLHVPLRIFADILGEVAQRAIELNDPKLNSLMCRLTVYEQTDPESPEYKEELTNKIIKIGIK